MPDLPRMHYSLAVSCHSLVMAAVMLPQEGNFRLPESAAILRYLATTHKACSDHIASLIPCFASRQLHWGGWLQMQAPVVSCACFGSPGRRGRSALLLTSSLTAIGGACMQVADNWFPADAQRQARVNAALDWHHSSIRRGVTGQARFLGCQLEVQLLTAIIVKATFSKVPLH